MQPIELRRPGKLAAFHRARRVAGRVVVTSWDGEFILLSPADYERYLAGTIEKDEPLYGELALRGLVRAAVDPARMAARGHDRKAFLGAGPNLHIVVVTKRCNETCVYCHSSRAPMDAAGVDMTPEVADAVVDRIFETTSPSITLEFQGGEPLVAFPMMKRIAARALEKNAAAGKRLEFTLVSNLSLMDDEKLAWLLEHKVQVCTSIDGPAPLHDKQRRLPSASAYASAEHWIRRINEAYERAGLDSTLYHVEALLTTTRDTLPLWKEVVDSYVSLGCRALFLRPLDPFGFADRASRHVEYPREEYLAFYRQAVDYMIELNLAGTQILERFAAIFLTKILSGVDPNYLDIRSPCGAGIGQLGWDHDGRAFTCDEGRMLRAMGDETFAIGDAQKDRYRQIVGHPTVRALAIASNLDALPGCRDCAYNPYCGVCPVHSHRTQGSIFARVPESTLCAVHMGIQDYLFEKIGQGDERVLDVFRKWTTIRPREHYLHLSTQHAGAGP